MAHYRDFGTWGSTMTPPEIPIDTAKKSLVYLATHDRAGNLLPARQRSFISFSYGGKNIEEFNLIACCEGDTMSRSGYAQFEDLVTNYDIMDGQYYHGTHFNPWTLSLKLVSDGIDLRQLDQFLSWFKGGITRELILAEHPNRAIMARVSLPPQLDVLPFEKKIEVPLGISVYKTSTTEYRGFIHLDLVADTPFWYAKQSLLVRDPSGNVIFQGINIGTDSNILQETLKVIYEDTIPSSDLVQSTMHFGSSQFALVGNNIAYTLIAGAINPDNPTEKPENWDELLSGKHGYFMVNGQYWKGARIETANSSTPQGRIAGAAIADEDDPASRPEDLASGQKDYNFFYGGTAPSPTILSFDISLESSLNGYINCIANTYAPASDGKEYSTITVGSENVKTFDFTTPNVITSWNKAYKMFNDIETYTSSIQGDLTIVSGTNWKDLADNMRDYIRHPAVRTFAIQLLNYLLSNNSNDRYLNTGVLTSEGKSLCLSTFKHFFATYRNGAWRSTDASFEFNSDTCEAFGTFTYWQAEDSSVNIIEIVLGTLTSELVTANCKEHTENVGDMLRSNWLILEDHNIFNENGYVTAWTDATPYYSHYLMHNLPANLKNLKLQYKQMYL